jgi:hypothetical protein
MTPTQRQLKQRLQPGDITAIVAALLSVLVYLITREDVFKTLCLAQICYLAGRQSKSGKV